MLEPSFVGDTTPIPDTLKTHKFVGFSRYNVPYNKFYYLSHDEKFHFQQWYGLACGHPENDVDIKPCASCLKRYHKSEVWLQCTTVCKKWFHESCFYD